MISDQYLNNIRIMKLGLIIVSLLTSVLSFAQQVDKEYVNELRSYYKEIEPDKFRTVTRVLEEDFMNNWKAYGGGVNEGKASSKNVSVKGFDKVIEIETHDKFYNDWDVEVGSKTAYPVLKNDLVYVTFWVRCLESRHESNQGFARVYLQKNSPNWDKSAYISVVAGRDWAFYRIPFHTKFENYDAGKAAVAFALGYSYQTIQLADIKITNFGSSVTKDDLPGTKFTYEGREDDAAWRKPANERIEKYRKGDLTVSVKDKSGKPVTNAQVVVEMKKHEFGFGNITNRVAFANPGPDGIQYRKIIKENFNETTFENAWKHDMYEQYKSENAVNQIFQVMDSLDKYGIDLRGHALVWPSTKYTKTAAPFIDKPEELRKLLRQSVLERATAAKGRLIDWDVINEPFVNHQFMDILGKDEMVEWFKIARQGDPEADLYINETRFLVDKGVNGPVQDNLYNWVEFLKSKGIQIDGLGFQGHFGETGLTSPDKLMEILDRFAKLGVKIKITELDINTQDNELQADYMRDFYTILFSHPAAEAIISWGFWEKYHWLPDAAWYTKNWEEKPIARVHKKLVFEDWWTNEKGITDASGKYKVRGFNGDYLVSVKHEGKTVVQKATLSKDGTTLEIIVK